MKSILRQLLLLFLVFSPVLVDYAAAGGGDASGVQPLSKIAIHRASLALNEAAYVRASPELLGLQVWALKPLASITCSGGAR